MKSRSNSVDKRNLLVRAVVVALAILITYLFVVIITTPSLPALTAITVAFKINGIIVFGLALAVGFQVYVSNYGKSLGCEIEDKRKAFVRNSSSTALSSFFSFFSLVPLGCCGSWLLILSLLPSVFGSVFSVFLIQYSKPLSYLGLFIVVGYTAFAAINLKRKLKGMEIHKGQSKISLM